jgi:hypothetical protein
VRDQREPKDEVAFSAREQSGVTCDLIFVSDRLRGIFPWRILCVYIIYTTVLS